MTNEIIMETVISYMNNWKKGVKWVDALWIVVVFKMPHILVKI